MQDIEFTVLNWEKYQFRKQIKSPSWFRLENRLWNDHQFFYFSAEERWIWICLLSLASQKQSSTLSISLEWLSQQSAVGRPSIESAMKKLKDNKCLDYAIRTRSALAPGCSATRQDNTRQDKTIQNNTKTVCTELKQASITAPTVDKRDLSFFINKKLLELYPQEYLDRERVKMEIWLASNGHKRPKSDRGMLRFITGWLSRGWDQYRRGLQSNAPKDRGIAEIMAEEEGNGFCDV